MAENEIKNIVLSTWWCIKVELHKNISYLTISEVWLNISIMMSYFVIWWDILQPAYVESYDIFKNIFYKLPVQNYLLQGTNLV